jgi:hypothetical protein
MSVERAAFFVGKLVVHGSGQPRFDIVVNGGHVR